MQMVTRVQVDGGRTWLRSCAAALLVAYLALSAYLLWRAAVLSPFSDEFNWATRWYRARADHDWLGYLLDPHNINRLVWTRLAMALDMGALGGTNAPLILSGAAAMSVMAWTLGVQAARAAPQPLKLTATALAVMLTLIAGNILDASIPINVTYTHGAVFSVLALVLSEGAPKNGLGWRRGAAMVCAVAAAFGSGVGLAVWPVMAWGALRRRNWSWLATVLICGAVFVGLYFSGQGHGADHASAAARHDPWNAIVLTLSFVTLPWTRVALQVAWVGGGLIFAGAGAIILIKGGPKATPVERVACGLILFTLGAAVMAGLGRTGLQDSHNVPLRYALLVAPMHVGLLMLAMPHVGDLWRRDRRLAEVLCLVVLLGVFAQNAAMAVKVVRASDVMRNAVADFHAGLRRPEMLTLVHPNLAYAEAVSDQLSRDDLFQHELHLKPRTPAR